MIQPIGKGAAPVRIAITGIGWMTPLGFGVDNVWTSLLEGRSGIGPISLFDTQGFSTKIAGEVSGFDPTEWIEGRKAKRFDRFAQFAAAAGSMAMEDSALDLDAIDRCRAGVVVGSGAGGMATIEEGQTKLLHKGPDRVPVCSVPKMMINAGSYVIARRYGLNGPNFGVVSACSTGAVALVQAALMIRSGMADVMLAGGSEASVTALSVASFSACRALSTRNGDPERASRPFDVDRDGFVMSEGAAVLVLESMDHAIARGARIYAELAGWGITEDAYHVTAPDPSSEPAGRAIANALDVAGATKKDVGYVNAHGTGTPLNDPAEISAIRYALNGMSGRIPISSTKSMLGHMLGAAGAVEAAVTALAVNTGRIPPTINVDNQDPSCDVDVVADGQRGVRGLELALSNSFAFGGHNVSLAIRKVESAGASNGGAR